jgi:hypothetical protein
MEKTTIELAYRRTGGIEAASFWKTATSELTVSVADRTSGDVFELPVTLDQALEVFHLPYAHVALEERASRAQRTTSSGTRGR